MQSALELEAKRCRELWRVYDKAQADLRPLLEANQVLEQQLDRLLARHDISSDGSYHAIFQAGGLYFRNAKLAYRVAEEAFSNQQIWI